MGRAWKSLALVLVSTLLASLSAPAQAPPRVESLIAAVSAGDDARLNKILKRARPNLFDIVASGFKRKSGTAEVDALIEKLPEDHGRRGIQELAKAYLALDPDKRSRWGAALRNCRKVEELIFAKKKKKRRGLKEALTDLVAQAIAVKEPWIRARSTLALLLAADKRLVAQPDGKAVSEAVEAFKTIGDGANVGLVLIGQARYLATLFDERAVKKTVEEGQAAIRASGRRKPDAREDLLRGTAMLVLSDLLIQLDRPAEARPILAELAKLFKEERPVALRTVRLLEAFCQCLTGDAKAAAKVAVGMRKAILGEEYPETLAHQAWLAARIMRVGEALSEVNDFLKKAKAVLKGAQNGAVLSLPLRYESGLALLASKQLNLAVTEMRVLRKLGVAMKRPQLSRLALQHLALHEARRGSKDTWKPYLEELTKVSLGDPEVDKVQAAAFNAHLAVALMGAEQKAGAMRALMQAKKLAEDLGMVTDDLPGARVFRIPGDEITLEDQLMEILPYHQMSGASKALVYGLTERRRLIELGKRLPPLAPPPETAEKLEKNKRDFKRLTISWSARGVPAAPNVAREIVEKRRSLVDSCRTRYPEVAIRLFPKPVPMRLVNTVTTKHRAAFLYIYFGKKGSFAYAISGSHWNFVGIAPKAGLEKNTQSVLEVLDGKHDRNRFLTAAGELHKWLVAPLKGTLTAAKNVFVIADPKLDGLNLGLLVPAGTKGKSWNMTPFMFRDKSWAQIPAASLLTRTSEGANRRAWSTERRFAGVYAGKAGPLNDIAALFDEKYKPTQALKHDHIRIVRSNDLAKTIAERGKLAGWFRAGGLLHLGPSVKIDPARIAATKHFKPEAVIYSEWPKGIEDRETWMLQNLVTGSDLVLAPRSRKVKAPVVQVMLERFWRGLSRQGFPPGQALGEAQRAFLMGRLHPDGKKPTDKQFHPAVWGNLQLLLRRL